MALSSTLFTGLSGLIANQTQLNVVGNNIANANTTAFKSSTVQFSPQFYVTDSTGSLATSTSGGSNPSQVGLGTQVASISENFAQGELQTTGVPSDLAINGSGFFIVKNGSQQQQFTRDGAFSLNSQNQLVDSSGDFVQGYGVNSNFQVVQSTLQNISIPPPNLATLAQATQNVSLQGTLNAGGDIATQGSVFNSIPLQVNGGGAITSNTSLTAIENLTGTQLYTAGQVLTLNAQQGGRDLPTQTLTITGSTTVGDLENFYQSGLAIDPNAPTGTPGVTIGSVDSAGDQGLVITGNVGTSNALTIPTGGLTDNGGADPLQLTPTNQAANGESTSTPITVYDSVGNPVTLDVSTVLVGQSNAGSTWNFTVTSPQNESGTPVLSTGTLAFNTTGQLISVDGVLGATAGTVNLNRTGTGATPDQQISLGFSGVQALSGATSNLVPLSQDGFAFGTFSSYSIGQDGTITASYSNGLTKTVGQVALATFADPDGLINNGNNQYSAGAASGNAIITAPETQGAGSIQASSLEMSNVDLSKEFINLIIASTGYSASSRVISTSDQLLTDLLNSQR